MISSYWWVVGRGSGSVVVQCERAVKCKGVRSSALEIISKCRQGRCVSMSMLFRNKFKIAERKCMLFRNTFKIAERKRSRGKRLPRKQKEAE